MPFPDSRHGRLRGGYGEGPLQRALPHRLFLQNSTVFCFDLSPGGGDVGLMHEIWSDFNGLPTEGMSYLDVSIDSHKMAFGAEQSRLSGKTVLIK